MSPSGGPEVRGPVDPAHRPAIVLVEPTGHRNVGSVARVMKNFGFSDLRLVDPRCDHLSMESRKMAMRAFDVLESARLFATLGDAVAECRKVVATTARSRQVNRSLQLPEPVMRVCAADGGGAVAVVFGSEEAGLTNDHLELADHWLTFPTVPGARSLNLAQSVGIACYEFNRHLHGSSTDVHRPSSHERPLRQSEFLALLADAERFLCQLNFLQPHTRKARMRRLTHLLRRASLSEGDGRLLKALFHTIAGSKGVLGVSSSSDSGCPPNG
jgi:tRNA/rRNA methyltransferase